MTSQARGLATPAQARKLHRGTLAAFVAYGMWGLLPLFWKQLSAVSALEVLCHRVIWSGLFLALVLLSQRRLGEVLRIWRERSSALAVVACAGLITLNWGIYIWAVQVDRVTEASLGYYITPLLSVALGAFLFHEKLDRWAGISTGLALLGVAVATWRLGSLPWVATVLSVSFALYGALKKKAGLDALSGLAAESLLCMPFALIYLAWKHGGAFFTGGPGTATLLILAGPVTAVPLLTFAYAAVRIPLQRLGFIQYFSPTLQLALGLFVLGEHLSGPMCFAFGTVVAAVLLYILSRPGQNRASA
ncbi:EamA family transporter [Geothrix limicola]|uniref:EamA family transporter n=1 Tax=Geothrix limicola TaxID=2927978 RepID=A0ABQ5QDD5_9BACT|nr:EamA family transporter RarD [Geothrix limicola]GLH72849.1 EamA family transporter [Geothrix limicola]